LAPNPNQNLDPTAPGSASGLGAMAVPSPLASAVGASAAPVPQSLLSVPPVQAENANGTSPQAEAKMSEDLETPLNEQPNFLTKLRQAASGALGLESPGSSPAARNGFLGMGLLRAVANGGALATATTPAMKNAAIEQEQIPLKAAALQNEAAYRGAMGRAALERGAASTQNAATGAFKAQGQFGTGENGSPEGTSRVAADVAQQNAASNTALRAAHTAQIEASLNGEVYVMPEIANSIGRPELAGKTMSPIQYQQQVANVVKSLGMKTVDLGQEGVWGASPITGRTTRLGDSPSVAREQGFLQRTQLPVNDLKGNTLGWVNPQTKTFTPVGSVPGVAQATGAVNEFGAPVVPPKPTSSMLTQGQMAQTILPQVQNIEGQVDKLAGEIGPGAGRWNQFWVNKAGTDDPNYAHLNQDLQLFATALGKAHFGSRIPQGFVEEMMKDFGTAQSPEDLKARIESADVWLKGYAARAGGTVAPSKPSPAAKEGGIYLFPDGTHRQVSADLVSKLPPGAKKVQ
jgi:hypothetical protein